MWSFNMHLNFFSLGLNKGEELIWAAKKIPKITNSYRIFGFEPINKHFCFVKKLTKNLLNVELCRYAVSNKEGFFPMYISPNTVGHSLFSTKNNVDLNNVELVQCVIFSKWLMNFVPTFKEDFNVMHVNIEGSEWHLFNDLVENNVHKYFSIFCGAGHDVKKVAELKDRYGEYLQLLNANNIRILRFCLTWKKEKNVNLFKIIKESYKNKNNKKLVI